MKHRRIALFMFAMSVASISYAGCGRLYANYYNCAANDITEGWCRQAIEEWKESPFCVAEVCNAYTQGPIGAQSVPLLNCGALPINQERYSACMSSKMGRDIGYATPEEICKQWAGYQ